MATGDWRGARDAFSAVLEVAEVPEALFGLANALFWLGDLAGTIASCEKAYAGFRRRATRCSPRVPRSRWWVTTRGISATQPPRAGGCHVLGGLSRMRFRSCAGSSWEPPRMLRTTRWRAR